MMHTTSRLWPVALLLAVLALVAGSLFAPPSIHGQDHQALITLRGVADGQTVSGVLHVEATPINGAQMRQIDFTLTGPVTLTNTEVQAPYWFLGHDGPKPNGWDTTTAPNGAYTLTATATAPDGQTSAITATFHVVNDGTTPTPAPSPPHGDRRLSWAPPTLSNPITLVLTNETVAAAYRRDGFVQLDPTRDYRILLPGAVENTQQRSPLQVPGGLRLRGGDDIVIIGGAIAHHVDYAAQRGCTGRERCARGQSRAHLMLGMYLSDWSGTLHIEGVSIAGDHLYEGINISTRNPDAVLQLQHLHIGRLQEPILWSKRAGNHDGSDVLQAWNGPAALRIDRMTVAHSPYATIFAQPLHFNGPVPKVWDIRNLNVNQEGYAFLFKTEADRWPQQPLTLTNVYVQRVGRQAKRPLGALVMPGADRGATTPQDDGITWKAGYRIAGRVLDGAPPTGDFVPAGAVGIGYQSPGYQ